MCCPFIVCVMIGVSNKAYSDTCDCLLNEFQVTLLNKQLQEHISNLEYMQWLLCCSQCNSFMAAPLNDRYACVCVCRLLQDHHSVQSRSDCSAVCRLFHSPLPAYRRESAPYRRYTVCAWRRNSLPVTCPKYTVHIAPSNTQMHTVDVLFTAWYFLSCICVYRCYSCYNNGSFKRSFNNYDCRFLYSN